MQEHVHYNIITKVSMFALKVYTSNKTVCFIKLHSYILDVTKKCFDADTNFSKKSSYKCQQAFPFKDFMVQVCSWYRCVHGTGVWQWITLLVYKTCLCLQDIQIKLLSILSTDNIVVYTLYFNNLQLIWLVYIRLQRTKYSQQLCFQ